MKQLINFSFIICFVLILFLIINHGVFAEEIDKDKLYEEAKILIDDHKGDSSKLYKAQKILDKILNYDPQYPKAYVGMAGIEYWKGAIKKGKFNDKNFKIAHNHLNKALELDPKLFTAHIKKAYIFMAQGDIINAKKHLEQAKLIDPNSPRNLVLEAHIEKNIGNNEKAIKKAREALNILEYKPYKSSALGVIIDVGWKTRNYDLAEEGYLKQIELDPDSAWTKNDYSNLLIRKKDYDKAIQYAKEALEIMEFGMAYRNLSTAYFWKGADLMWQQNKPEEAVEYFQLSLEANPYNPKAYYGMGIYYRNKFNQVPTFEEKCDYLQKSEKEFSKALDIDPNDQDSKRELELTVGMLKRCKK